MALANSLVGDGKLVYKDSRIRKWSVVTPTSDITWQETTTEEEREWVAVTEAVAESAVDAADQSGIPAGAVATWSMSEDNRVIGSYKVTKTITSKTITTV